MSKLSHLHIVSFDNPFPPNYGGVIDVFYKLKTLAKQGVEITLHVFEYGREPAKELNKFCKKVYYYPRRTFVNPFVGSLPYIVSTRNSEELLQNLKKDNHPILFEGLHTCFFLDNPALKNRFKIVRTHNIEHDYYENLENVESNFFKKYFFSKEAARLKSFEQILHHAQLIIAISEKDKNYLNKHYKNVHHIAAFHSNEKITAKTGKGSYAFYHGKLSVGENDEAARFLVGKIFSQTDYPLHIAGDNPSKELRKLIEANSNIHLFENLNTKVISQKIQNAHINILPTFQATGIKLKLINALFQGRHILANNEMVQQTGLEHLCHIANSEKEFLKQLTKLKDISFSQEEINKRAKTLLPLFDNDKNVEKLREVIIS